MFHPFSSEKSPFLSSTSISSVPSLGSAGAPRPRHGRAGAPRRGSAAAGGRSSRGQSRPGCCRSPADGALVRYKLPSGNLT